MKQQKAPRKMVNLTDYTLPTASKRKRATRSGLMRLKTSSQGDESGATRGLKPLPAVLEQGPYESEQQFLNRVSSLSVQAKAEASLEERFDLDLCPVLPEVLSTRSGEAVGRKGKKVRLRNGMTEEERREAKRVKRRQRDARRRRKGKKGAKSVDDNDDFDQFRDQVSFGEVVTAPPRFSRRQSVC